MLAFFPAPPYGRCSTITHGRGGAYAYQEEAEDDEDGDRHAAVSTLDLTKPLKVSASATPRTKSDVFATIAQHADLHRRDVVAVFHALGALIKADLSKLGAGVFKIPGMLRIAVIRKPATKARMGG